MKKIMCFCLIFLLTLSSCTAPSEVILAESESSYECTTAPERSPEELAKEPNYGSDRTVNAADVRRMEWFGNEDDGTEIQGESAHPERIENVLSELLELKTTSLVKWPADDGSTLGVRFFNDERSVLTVYITENRLMLWDMAGREEESVWLGWEKYNEVLALFDLKPIAPEPNEVVPTPQNSSESFGHRKVEIKTQPRELSESLDIYNGEQAGLPNVKTEKNRLVRKVYDHVYKLTQTAPSVIDHGESSWGSYDLFLQYNRQKIQVNVHTDHTLQWRLFEDECGNFVGESTYYQLTDEQAKELYDLLLKLSKQMEPSE